jgi:hypothetical protein
MQGIHGNERKVALIELLSESAIQKLSQLMSNQKGLKQ